MREITYNDPTLQPGEFVFVDDLAVLINGEPVEIADHAIEQFEALYGKGAFERIEHTDLYSGGKAIKARPLTKNDVATDSDKLQRI